MCRISRLWLYGPGGEELLDYHGIFVLRTNAAISPLQAVLRYRDLLQVESLFRTAKALMRTRPIYHQSDAAIRGHVFCSFLALVLKWENPTPETMQDHPRLASSAEPTDDRASESSEQRIPYQ